MMMISKIFTLFFVALMGHAAMVSSLTEVTDKVSRSNRIGASDTMTKDAFRKLMLEDLNHRKLDDEECSLVFRQCTLGALSDALSDEDSDNTVYGGLSCGALFEPNDNVCGDICCVGSKAVCCELSGGGIAVVTIVPLVALLLIILASCSCCSCCPLYSKLCCSSQERK